MEFISAENRSAPLDRTYAEYIRDGEAAARTGGHVNGVKGIWVFDALPYASHICVIKDLMHTAANIIKDGMQVLVYNKNHRCLRAACKSDSIAIKMHTSIYNNDHAVVLPWVFTAAMCLKFDLRMSRLIGVSSAETVKNVVTKGRAKNCHDLIYWGTTFARFLAIHVCL